jgi:hypothetical protein
VAARRASTARARAQPGGTIRAGYHRKIMAELEIHHHVEHHDAEGRRAGVQSAAIAILLAVVSIAAHRAHTQATILMTSSADRWQFFQSRRNRYYNAELKADLLTAIGQKNPASEAALLKAQEQMKKATEETEEARKEARNIESEAHHQEAAALRYDIGEGFLEIGLVTTSLFFIARRKLFPLMGIIAAIAGVCVAVSALFMH